MPKNVRVKPHIQPENMTIHETCGVAELLTDCSYTCQGMHKQMKHNVKRCRNFCKFLYIRV